MALEVVKEKSTNSPFLSVSSSGTSNLTPIQRWKEIGNLKILSTITHSSSIVICVNHKTIKLLFTKMSFSSPPFVNVHWNRSKSNYNCGNYSGNSTLDWMKLSLNEIISGWWWKQIFIELHLIQSRKFHNQLIIIQFIKHISLTL